MKRFIIFILTLSLIFSLSFSVNAQNENTEQLNETEASKEEVSTGKEEASSESGISTKEKTASTPEVSESSSNESSDTNPIGDSSSYYNLEELGSGPDITAESALLMDASTGAVLYSKEGDTKRYPASITKVMTALLTIENCSMSDIVTFSNEAVNGIEAGSSSAGINVGAELTVEDTLYAMMLVSANEAAAALAEHVSGSIDEFAKLMTRRAKELGCTGTNFTNPHGLPDENHYTTAHDMALILKQALKYDSFRKIASTESYTLKKSDTLTNTLELWNHAKILRSSSEYYYKPAEGAKTGYTQAALNTLVTYAKKGDVELLCVILKDYGADSSYYDSADLYDWGFEQVESITPLKDFDFNTALEENDSIESKQLDSIKTLNPVVCEDYYILVKKGFDSSDIKTSFSLEEDKNTGLLGYIYIYSGDTVIGTSPVTYDITTDAAQAYLNGQDADDDLEIAEVDEGITPHKILEYMVRIIIAIILVVIIMGFIGRHQSNKKRKKRLSETSRRRRNKK